MTGRPHFRFYPNAYVEDGPFEASDESCEVCQRPAVGMFTGVIYKEGDGDPTACARCIADGGLNKIAPDYTLHDMDFSEAPSPELAREVEQRTPGFATWNAFSWPVRESVPLAFIGYGGDDPMPSAEIDAAIKAAADEWEIDELDPQHALLFRTLDGEVTIAVLDFD